MNCSISEEKSKSVARNFELTVIAFGILKKRSNEGSAPTRFLTVTAGPVLDEVGVDESREEKIANPLKKTIVTEGKEMIAPEKLEIEIVMSPGNELSVAVNLEGIPIFNGIAETGEAIPVVEVEVDAMIDV